MKRRTKQIIALAALVAAGSLGLALYPALLPDTNDSEPSFCSCALASPEGGSLQDLLTPIDIRYSINITAPAGETRYVGDISPKSFSSLQEAKWNIHLFTRGQELFVESSPPVLRASHPLSHVRYSYAVKCNDQEDRDREKQPDGSYHPIYFVHFIFSASVQPSFWGKRTSTLAQQTLKVDPVAGSVDIVEPRMPMESLMGRHTSLCVRYPVAGLASRFGDEPKERALNIILLNLGKIDRREIAYQAGERLPEAAGKMLANQTESDKPWPECWGDAAPFAQQCAQQIVPTLFYLQENSCFGVKKLADFINSPTFARYFGESFADKAPDPLDEPMEHFTIEKVSDLGETE